MNRIDHQDFFDTDLPRLEGEIGDDTEFDEFLYCLDKAIREIMKDPANEGVPLPGRLWHLHIGKRNSTR